MEAVDKAGKVAPVLAWDFEVTAKEKFDTIPTWTPRSEAKKAGVRDEYFVNESYETSSVRLNRTELFVHYANLNPDTITYKLVFAQRRLPGPFLVGADGATLAKPTSKGNYSATLAAVDGKGDIAVVFVWDFVVTEPPVFTTVHWDPAAEATKAGMRTTYDTMKTYSTPHIRRKRSDLFVHSGGSDPSKISYKLVFTSLASAVAVEVGNFLVDSTTGSTLASPSIPGQYRGVLAAVDANGATTPVYMWSFEVQPKPTFATAPGWNSSSLNPSNGYKTLYAVGNSSELAAPSEGRGDLFVHFAGDASTISYSMMFTPRCNDDPYSQLSTHPTVASSTPAFTRPHAGSPPAVPGTPSTPPRVPTTAPIAPVTGRHRRQKDTIDERVHDHRGIDAGGATEIGSHPAPSPAPAPLSPGHHSPSATCEATPGKFYVDQSGASFATPAHKGVYDASLTATDEAGSRVVVKQWAFRVLPKDTDVPTFGPHQHGCQHGTVYDAIKFDRHFTCICLESFVGDNCALKEASENSLAYVLASLSAIVLLVGIISLLHYRRAKQIRNAPFEFTSLLTQLREDGWLREDFEEDAFVQRAEANNKASDRVALLPVRHQTGGNSSADGIPMHKLVSRDAEPLRVGASTATASTTNETAMQDAVIFATSANLARPREIAGVRLTLLKRISGGAFGDVYDGMLNERARFVLERVAGLFESLCGSRSVMRAMLYIAALLKANALPTLFSRLMARHL